MNATKMIFLPETITYTEDSRQCEVAQDDLNILRCQYGTINRRAETEMGFLSSQQQISSQHETFGNSYTDLPPLSRSSSRSSIFTLPTPTLGGNTYSASPSEIRLSSTQDLLLHSDLYEPPQVKSRNETEAMELLSERPIELPLGANCIAFSPQSPSASSEKGGTSTSASNVIRHNRSVQSFTDFKATLAEKQRRARQAQASAVAGSAYRAVATEHNPFDEAFSVAANLAYQHRSGPVRLQQVESLASSVMLSESKLAATNSQIQSLSSTQSSSVALLRLKRIHDSFVRGFRRTNVK